MSIVATLRNWSPAAARAIMYACRFPVSQAHSGRSASVLNLAVLLLHVARSGDGLVRQLADTGLQHGGERCTDADADANGRSTFDCAALGPGAGECYGSGRPV